MMPKTAKRTNRIAKRAKVILNLGGKEPEIEKSVNVPSITEVNSTVFVVHFDVPFPDELYRCEVISGEPVKFTIKTRRKEGVGIQVAKPWPKRLMILCEAV
jgi:hypothetical protein